MRPASTARARLASNFADCGESLKARGLRVGMVGARAAAGLGHRTDDREGPRGRNSWACNRLSLQTDASATRTIAGQALFRAFAATTVKRTRRASYGELRPARCPRVEHHRVDAHPM